MHTLNSVYPYILGVAGYAIHYKTVQRQLTKHARFIKMIVAAGQVVSPAMNDITELGTKAESGTDTDV